MKKIIRKTTGTVLGLTLALVSGAPILADDTELLLVAPPNPAELKPNVLFILDTSGSMTSIQKTSAPYDSTEIYSAFGDCDANNLYYSDGSGEPVCEGATRYIAKSSWNCAASLIQIADVGTYTDVLETSMPLPVPIQYLGRVTRTRKLPGAVRDATSRTRSGTVIT